MTTRSRALVAAAALLLGLLYALPIWSIALEAPQYPEGIGMMIWIDEITGAKPHDLDNINGLNHYIGMKEIVPEAIPELRIMPWLFAGLIAFGLVAAAAGRRGLLYAWVGVFAVIAVAGMVDFWLWEYDYGHDLDPTAAIQVPGMTYQPPLIGSKQMLNITAHSWPASGMWAAIVSLLTGLGVAVAEWRRARAARSAAGVSAAPVAGGAVVLAALLVAGCGEPAPEAIAYGTDACAHCRMTVSDDRFGTELVTPTGKTFAFDSIECLAAHLAATPEADVHSLWVTRYDTPGALVPLDEAVIVRDPSIHSPMGQGLAAWSPEAVPPDAERLVWDDVVALAGSGHGHPMRDSEAESGAEVPVHATHDAR